MPAALTERCQKGMVLSCLHPVLPPASWIPAQNRPEESTGSLLAVSGLFVLLQGAARLVEERGAASASLSQPCWLTARCSAALG